MKNKVFFILAFTIVIIYSQNSELIPSKYNILLTLTKYNIEPSKSLCRQIGMSKVQKFCLQNNEGFVKLRRQKKMYTEKSLCNILKLSYCQSTCCLNSGRCKNSAIVVNDSLTQIQKSQQIYCQNDQPTLETECKESGLLWCAGQCCGFSNKNHKCYKIAHYGIPYIRCPIQA